MSVAEIRLVAQGAEDDLMKKIGRLEVEIDFLRRVSLACGLNPEKRK